MIFLWIVHGLVLAQDSVAPVAKEADFASDETPEEVRPARKRSSQVKEAEGTRALDRNEFEADGLIRSKYTLNGVMLEVDTD